MFQQIYGNQICNKFNIYFEKLVIQNFIYEFKPNFNFTFQFLEHTNKLQKGLKIQDEPGMDSGSFMLNYLLDSVKRRVLKK